MSVLFVVTEHRRSLDADADARYESARQRLQEAARRPVSSAHYEDVDDFAGYDAVVLSGSFAPWSAHDPSALESLLDSLRSYEGPTLGICAGAQLQAVAAGGSVRTTRVAEAAYRMVDVVDDTDLLRGLRRGSFYAHHSDEIVEVPDGFRVLATSADCRVEAIGDGARRWWGTQFHPELFSPEHPDGRTVIRNFFDLL